MADTIVVRSTPTPSVIVSAKQGPAGLSWNLVEGFFDSSRFTVTSLNDQIIDSFQYTEYGAAKYVIYATLGLQRQISEILLIQDGTNVQTVEYANMVTSSLLGTYHATLVNSFVNIVVSPLVIGTSFKVIRTLIKD